MYEFTYSKPQSIDEAIKALSADGSQPLAGGQTLLPTLKQRLAMPDQLVDLSGIDALQSIGVSANSVTIGAMSTHAMVASSTDVQKAIPALAALAGNIGDPQVRNRGTIGGSIANNDPASDYPAGCLALGATIITNVREIASDDFFTGLFEVALEEGELITHIRFPIPSAANYQKFDQPASRYALVGVFVAKHKDGAIRVAVTGAGDNGVFRLDKFEAALQSVFSAQALDGLKVDHDLMLADIHGSAQYRAHLIGVIAKRAVSAC